MATDAEYAPVMLAYGKMIRREHVGVALEFYERLQATKAVDAFCGTAKAILGNVIVPRTFEMAFNSLFSARAGPKGWFAFARFWIEGFGDQQLAGDVRVSIEEAAKSKDWKALLMAAHCYQRGWPVQKDVGTALKCFTQLNAMDRPEGACGKAQMVLDHDIDESPKVIDSLATAVTKHNSARAAYLLARLCHRRDIELFAERDVHCGMLQVSLLLKANNRVGAVRLLENFAAAGVPVARYRLGVERLDTDAASAAFAN